ncbi:hypothetical protein BKE30_06855 [Alkanindiges hydrocarboniclasticus]|uniref:Pyrrolo-quinoline quinone repeat domain-containing protein n=1 Tax=Alkanindiges hydrocarboniclasticus TaxID=1907941 RepID=A0A1S8CWK3_9GAMM|nr:PQQ-binding-like beta-propeller repeat protein [Alkanindiges hydrocarboniclasticus]ONG40859.1 hypothetical protein BKE30_06855 [Alkanindiges hydrocarboniclasticus]
MKHYLLTTLLTLSSLGSMQAAQAVRCSATIDPLQQVLANSLGYNLNNTRQGISAINSGNVSQLELAYVHVAPDPDATERRGAPTLTHQVIYAPTRSSIVALDRATGCEYWNYTIKVGSSIAGGDGFRAMNYVPALGSKPALVVAGDSEGKLHVLNAQTGQLLWQKFVGTDKAYHRITATPQFYQGKLLVGMASREIFTALSKFVMACCESHGLLVSVDAYSGKIDWTYHTTAAAQRLWDLHHGPNGVPVWSTPAIDEASHTVYIGTGQNYSMPITSNSDSIIALDARNGKVKWIFQATANDSYPIACGAPFPLNGPCSPLQSSDFDFGASPIISTTRSGRKVILAGSKNGVVYSLDAVNGQLNWQKRLGAGANLGGIHWGMATDRQRLYVAVSDVMINKMNALSIDQLNTPLHNPASHSGPNGKGMSLAPNGKPGVYALDIENGNLLWEQHPSHVASDGNSYPSAYSAAVAVTNDVVFAGSLNGVMKAFRSTDGRELWSYNTAKPVNGVNGISGNGGTIDQVGAYIGGNNLIINSGYDQFGGTNTLQAGPGNAMYVFRLAGTR